MYIVKLSVSGQIKTLANPTEEILIENLKSMMASPDFVLDVVKEYLDFISCPLSGSRGLHGGKQTFKFRKVSGIDFDRFNSFIASYGRSLLNSMELAPEEYFGTFETTLENMKYAIAEGSFNKDSKSFKQTCKELGIKHTYKAINAYLRGE